MPTFFVEKTAAELNPGFGETDPRLKELLEKPILLFEDNEKVAGEFGELFPHTVDGGRVQQHVVQALPLSDGLIEANVCHATIEITSVMKNYYDFLMLHSRAAEFVPQYYINFRLAYPPSRKNTEPQVRNFHVSTLSTLEQASVMWPVDGSLPDREKERIAQNNLRLWERLQQTRTEFALFRTNLTSVIGPESIV